MARGYGRLDITTLMVLLRHRLQAEDLQRFTLCFDKDQGFSGWYGSHEPDEHRWFDSLDSVLLALLIGESSVPGIDDD